LAHKGDYYGYSLALGSADVNLLSLTNAYRSLANHGRASAIRTQLGLPPATSQTVLDPAASFVIGDILADRSARAPTFGLESALATRIWTAVKTGTSKDMRDNWCIGYSSRYTVGVWVGNASGLPMWDVSGVTGAAPVWHEVMHYLHRPATGIKSIPPSAPPGVEAQNIRYQEQNEVPRSEYFLAGTKQEIISAAHPERDFASIRYPTPGMLIALDPDIPPARQRVRLLAQGLRTGKLVLDGKTLPAQVNAKQELLRDWMPWPGKHVLQLMDSKGQVLDQVKFEVRGAVEAGPKPRKKRAVR
jgi:penicillin-binding protein 1C